MFFFFNFGTAINVWFDGLRGIPLRAGVPCSKVPSKRPADAKQRYREAGCRKHGTTMTRRTPRKGRLRPGKLQPIQSAAVSTCCQFWFTEEFRRKGRRSIKKKTATTRGRPPQSRNDHDPPHTAERPPQARQCAASPIRWSFHLLLIWFPWEPTSPQWLVFHTSSLVDPRLDHNRNCANEHSTHIPCGGHVCTRQLPTFLH